MKLILVMVTSLDGRSTQKNSTRNIHTWTSTEDRRYFKDIINNAKLMIMGSKTYDAAKDNMQHKEGRLRIVVTRTPEKYDNEKIPGKLEFTNENPTDLIKRLEQQEFHEGYLLGGANTNTEFFKEGLISEMWQTLEPVILGLGNGLIEEDESKFNLKLLSVEKMNGRGTLLLKYKVLVIPAKAVI